MHAKPFLKWAGGKARLAPLIADLMPERFASYRESFLGAGAVFFELHRRQAFKRAALSDSNVELVTTWKVIQNAQHLEKLISWLKRFEKKYRLASDDERSAMFYELRDMNWQMLQPAHAAGRMIALNRTCFNGLYRLNKKGEFNVPFGQHDNPTILNEANLRLVHEALKGVDIYASKWNDLYVPSTVEYCDPPYIPKSTTANFTAYTVDGFDDEQQAMLARYVRESHDSNKRLIIVTNSDTARTRHLYRGLVWKRVGMRRNINSNGSDRGEVGELIIRSISKKGKRSC